MTLRILVCGGRDYTDAAHLAAVLNRVHAKRGIGTIIHGACPVGHGGADWLADAWAKQHGVPVEAYPVDHAVDGPWPGAGPKRNRRMLEASKPQGVVAFPGGRGTAAMAKMATEAGVGVLWG